MSPSLHFEGHHRGSEALNLDELREEASCDIRMDTHTHNLPTWAYHWSRLKMLVLSRWLLRRCIPCGPTKMTPLCRFLWNLRWAKYTKQVDQVVCHQGNQARPNGSRLFFQQALGTSGFWSWKRGEQMRGLRLVKYSRAFFWGRIMPWIDDVSAFCERNPWMPWTFYEVSKFWLMIFYFDNFALHNLRVQKKT